MCQCNCSGHMSFAVYLASLRQHACMVLRGTCQDAPSHQHEGGPAGAQGDAQIDARLLPSTYPSRNNRLGDSGERVTQSSLSTRHIRKAINMAAAAAASEASAGAAADAPLA